MRSIRKRLNRAVLAALPAAVLAAGGCSRSAEVPAACGGARGGADVIRDGGCGSCDPVAEQCFSQYTGGACRRTCNDCGCTHQVVVDPSPGLAPIGFGLPPDVCAARCGAAPSPEAALIECHHEYRADGSAVPAEDGGALLSCAWDVDGGACAPGALPCARCDPAAELCDPAQGRCIPLGGFCGGPGSTNLVDASTAAGARGEVEVARCADLCDRPSSVSLGDAPTECHLELGPDGKPLRCEDQAVVSCHWPSQSKCTGRRPEGLEPAPAGRDLGGQLAEMAWLEAASVPAFRRLERELAELGAPAALRARARAAARDEVRHARAMARLARRHGASVPRVRLPPARRRTRVEVAIENATEGCVRETFGAALARWQALRATDASVRAALESIAGDEAAHAELAWDVAAWLEARCTPAERAEVEAARRQAVAALAASLDAPGAAAARAPLGLPGQAEGRRLFEAVSLELWAAA